MQEIKLTYGLREGNLIHVNEVESGVECRCICPKCNAPLMARKGSVRRHHFAHYNAPECEGAQMTVLHRMAQEIIAEEKTIMLPNYEGEFFKQPGIKKKFDEIVLEVALYDSNHVIYRPDCVARNTQGIGELWIELYVTHKLTTEKKEYIQKNGIYCIEIDLRQLLNTDFNQQTISNFLTSNKEGRTWINCPAYDKREKKEKEQSDKRYHDWQNKIENIRLDEEIRYKNTLIRNKELVESFLHNGDVATAKEVIRILSYRNYSYWNELLPYTNLLDFCHKMPKTEGGLMVFDFLLDYRQCKVLSSSNTDMTIIIDELSSFPSMGKLQDSDKYLYEYLYTVYTLWYIHGVLPKKLNVQQYDYENEYISTYKSLLLHHEKRKDIIDSLFTLFEKPLDERMEIALDDLISKIKEEQEKNVCEVNDYLELMNEDNPESLTFRMNNWSKVELDSQIQKTQDELRNAKLEIDKDIISIRLNKMSRFREEHWEESNNPVN